MSSNKPKWDRYVRLLNKATHKIPQLTDALRPRNEELEKKIRRLEHALEE